MNFKFKVYRNCDDKKLRKVSVELYYFENGAGGLVDKSRMFGLFGGAFFERRLARRKLRMLKRAKAMLQASVYL